MNSLADIRDFLAQKRIAVVGVSRNPKDFSRSLLNELVAQGYDVVAVNPSTNQVNGNQCVPRLQDVTPAPDAVLLMTSHAVTDDLLHDWNSTIRRVWIYGFRGRTQVSALAIAQLRNAGVSVINGECPFMFLKDSGGIHKVHGFVRKVFRTYPA